MAINKTSANEVKSARVGGVRTGAGAITIENIMTQAPAGKNVTFTAVIEGLEGLPANYKLHWTFVGFGKVTVIEGQDGRLTDIPDKAGNYYATLVVNVHSGDVTFTAHLQPFDGTTNLVSSPPKAVDFRIRVEEPQFVASDKYFAWAGPPEFENNRIRLWSYVYDVLGNPMEGFEFRWSSAQDFIRFGSTEDVFFWQFPGPIGEPGPATLPVAAATVQGWPVTVTDSDGMAEVWVTSSATHSMRMIAEMNGATSLPALDLAIVTPNTPVNAAMSAPTIMGNIGPNGLIPDPGSDELAISIRTDGVVPQPALTDRVIVAIGWYTDLISGNWEYVVTDVPVTTTWGAIKNNPRLLLPYADLMTQDEADANLPPGGVMPRRNRIMWFIQSAAGVAQQGLSTSFNMEGNPLNTPNPDTSLNRILQEASINPYPSTGFITGPLMEPNGGMTVNIPKVPPAYRGGEITVYLQVNGYWPGTISPRRGYHVLTGEQASSTTVVRVPIPQSLLEGFAVSTNGDIGQTYFDYSVQGPSDAAWGQYPHGYKMST